jgi:hypothetical protein
METASGMLRINEYGSTVPVTSITPAEALVLKNGFEVVSKGETLCDMTMQGDKEVDSRELLQYLKERYVNMKDPDGEIGLVEKLFPGSSPKLPTTFDEVFSTEYVAKHFSAA